MLGFQPQNRTWVISVAHHVACEDMGAWPSITLCAKHNKTRKPVRIVGCMTPSKNPSCSPCRAQGGYFATAVNKMEDNYIDPMVSGIISHEKTTVTTWTRCRARLLRNIKKTQFGRDKMAALARCPNHRVLMVRFKYFHRSLISSCFIPGFGDVGNSNLITGAGLCCWCSCWGSCAG